MDSTETSGFKLPFIKRALKTASREVTLFASPWAPPAWMTESGKTTGNPVLRKDPEVQQAYAEYLRKFFEAYEAEGVHFWGVTA